MKKPTLLKNVIANHDTKRHHEGAKGDRGDLRSLHVKTSRDSHGKRSLPGNDVSPLKDLLQFVKKGEYSKFATMVFLVFFILFDYYLIYALKESLIIPKLGAEIVGFMELWVVLPSVFIFTLCYIKLSTFVKNKETIFHIICGFFLSFFIIFALLLYPNLDAICPHKAQINELMAEFPRLKWFILIYHNWPLALFNIFSELWVNTMLSLLFWQYANCITPPEQAKRFYPILGLVGNFSLIACGIFLNHAAIHNDEAKAVKNVTILIVIIGLICMTLFRFLYQSEGVGSAKKKKPKSMISFKESLKLIFSSKYLWYLAVAVIAYSITINLSFGLWRSQVIQLYPSTKEYMMFMAEYHKWVGSMSIIVMIVAYVMIRKLSWISSALTTPLVMVVTGSIFLIFISIHEVIVKYISMHSYLLFSVLVGTIHITLSKASKFSFFDTTKELAYIPMEANLRDKGKAAVDVLGERFGRSGGAFIQSMCFMMVPSATYAQFAPLFLIVSLVVWSMWLLAIKALNSQYLKCSKGG